MPTTDPALTALPGWEWPEDPMPVLTTSNGRTVREVLDRETILALMALGYVIRPDLDAPQWGGALLAALGPGWNVRCLRDGGYAVYEDPRDGAMAYAGHTLASACAAALLARGWYRRTP